MGRAVVGASPEPSIPDFELTDDEEMKPVKLEGHGDDAISVDRNNNPSAAMSYDANNVMATPERATPAGAADGGSLAAVVVVSPTSTRSPSVSTATAAAAALSLANFLHLESNTTGRSSGDTRQDPKSDPHALADADPSAMRSAAAAAASGSNGTVSHVSQAHQHNDPTARRARGARAGSTGKRSSEESADSQDDANNCLGSPNGGDGPRYSCETCGHQVRFWSQLQRHMLKHQTAQNFACEHCGRRYKRRQALDRHFRTQHQNLFPYYCRVCHKGMATVRRLEQHLYSKHKVHLTAAELHALRAQGLASVVSKGSELIGAAAAGDGRMTSAHSGADISDDESSSSPPPTEVDRLRSADGVRNAGALGASSAFWRAQQVLAQPPSGLPLSSPSTAGIVQNPLHAYWQQLQQPQPQGVSAAMQLQALAHQTPRPADGTVAAATAYPAAAFFPFSAGSLPALQAQMHAQLQAQMRAQAQVHSQPAYGGLMLPRPSTNASGMAPFPLMAHTLPQASFAQQSLGAGASGLYSGGLFAPSFSSFNAQMPMMLQAMTQTPGSQPPSSH